MLTAAPDSASQTNLWVQQLPVDPTNEYHHWVNRPQFQRELSQLHPGPHIILEQVIQQLAIQTLVIGNRAPTEQDFSPSFFLFYLSKIATTQGKKQLQVKEVSITSSSSYKNAKSITDLQKARLIGLIPTGEGQWSVVGAPVWEQIVSPQTEIVVIRKQNPLLKILTPNAFQRSIGHLTRIQNATCPAFQALATLYGFYVQFVRRERDLYHSKRNPYLRAVWTSFNPPFDIQKERYENTYLDFREYFGKKWGSTPDRPMTLTGCRVLAYDRKIPFSKAYLQYEKEWAAWCKRLNSAMGPGVNTTLEAMAADSLAGPRPVAPPASWTPVYKNFAFFYFPGLDPEHSYSVERSGSTGGPYICPDKLYPRERFLFYLDVNFPYPPVLHDLDKNHIFLDLGWMEMLHPPVVECDTYYAIVPERWLPRILPHLSADAGLAKQGKYPSPSMINHINWIGLNDVQHDTLRQVCHKLITTSPEFF